METKTKQQKIKGGSPRGKVERGWPKKEARRTNKEAREHPERTKKEAGERPERTKKEARERPGRTKKSKRKK